MPSTTLETMEINISDEIALITLTREAALNAMNSAFFQDFQRALKEISPDQNVKALIITGRGNGFSVGADLKNLPINDDLDLGKSLRENFVPMVAGIKGLPFPTIAAINGYAAGAGMGLMLACDFTLAAKSAQFVQAFINIALVPDAGSSYFLPRLIGRARAAEMMMLGENIGAEEAQRMGLIYKMVDDDKLQEQAFALAQKLKLKPTKTLVQIRNLLDASYENSLEGQLEEEVKAQQIAGKDENFMEGVNAFREKRTPKFK